MIDAVADLLVAGEADADRAVRNLRMGRQVRRRFHDDGNARLVIGAEKCGAAGGDDVVAFATFQVGMFAGEDDLMGIVG